jgi:hypothetical protein
MPYFPDLSPYSFLLPADQVCADLLNVGWLSRWHSFHKGAVDQSVVHALLRLCRKPARLTRGAQRCDFCGMFPLWMAVDGEKVPLGNGEIRVSGAFGKTYAAPTLICHYIAEHAYCPPQEFLNSITELQQPGSPYSDGGV